METSPIKDVAIYLRKSRGDEDKDLEKHREALLEIAKTNSWRYVTFEEIATSESIVDRPKFSQLLAEVIDGMYDAVMVESYDRLGRGEEEDQGKIRNAFKSSSTYVVTPEKIYDLNNESDEDHYKFKGFFANWEYTSIKRRLNRGKKRGAKRGEWTNGKPPYPYIYVAAKKGLELSPEKNVIYQEFKHRALNGETLVQIEHDLNNRNIPGPTGGIWHLNTISRILVDETHLGRIISGKSEGSGHLKKTTKKLVFFPRDKWTIVENCHIAVKTIEEHEKIISIFRVNTLIPQRAKAGVYPLSGVVYCGKCKKMMRYNVRTDKYTTSAFKACNKYDHYGNYCDNRGLSIKIITSALLDRVSLFEKELMDSENYHNAHLHDRLERSLLEKESYLEKLKKSLQKIKKLYEMDDYTDEEYLHHKTERQKEINVIEEDIKNIRFQIDYDLRKNNKERLATIHSFKEIWNSEDASDNDKNVIAKKLFSRIEYIYENIEDVSIVIEFN